MIMITKMANRIASRILKSLFFPLKWGIFGFLPPKWERRLLFELYRGDKRFAAEGKGFGQKEEKMADSKD